MIRTADVILGVATGELSRGLKGAAFQPGKVHWNGDPRYSIYTHWYGYHDFWCAMFVSWCANQSGMLGEIIPRHMSTPAGADWFKARGRWTNGLSGVRRGDILYMRIGAARGYVNHVGIVESVNGLGAYTIEGNTSRADMPGSEDSGGCVARKLRGPLSRGITIVGYGRPAYDREGVTAPDLEWTFDLPHTSVGLVTDGYWGRATTAALQKCFGTYVDGVVSSQYSAHRSNNPGLTSGWEWVGAPKGSPLMRAMQNWLGVPADGIGGPTTFRALQSRVGTFADGTFWARSPAIAEMQRRLNAGSLR